MANELTASDEMVPTRPRVYMSDCYGVVLVACVCEETDEVYAGYEYEGGVV
jgi:hypothetical protein